MRTLIVCPILALTILATFPLAEPGSRWEWTGISRVVGVGDIHGSLEKLQTVLQHAGLVDGQLKWSGTTAHVVFCGDLVDRGAEDRQVLDLVRRLQDEAEAAGGRVHTLLGNHEVMNLVRDLRYVSEASYAGFIAEERPDDRRKAWEAFRSVNASKGQEQEVRAAFDKHFPPGYFGRVRAFARNGQYGAWLMKQPAIVKVNGVVFLHGGLTPEVARLGLEAINRDVQDNVRAAVTAIDALQAQVAVPLAYADARVLAGQISNSPASAPNLMSAARDLLKQTDGLAFAPDGPLWYRGVSLENERAERDPVSRALAAVQARAMMVGHTVTRPREVTSRFNGTVVRGDVGMVFGGVASAVEFDAAGARVLAADRPQPSSPRVEPPQGEGWGTGFEHLPDDRIVRFLSTGSVVSKQTITRGGDRAEIWQMKGDGLKLRAVFRDKPEHARDIAAFKMDRLLGLGMVPVTVERRDGARAGALRIVLEDAVDLVSVKAYEQLEGVDRESLGVRIAQRYGLELQDLRQQAARMWIFDALIGNASREDEDKLLIPGEGRIALVDHARAFTESNEIAAYLPVPCTGVDPELLMHLRSLDAGGLKAAVGSQLTSRQMEAILARRDRILARCGGSGAPADR
jgi:hypothetical protein